jgi:3-oxoacyl-[acyl-carrier protein] reductase
VKPRALVTGSSRGIGAAIAEALAAAGHPIILNFVRDHKAASAVKGRIESAGGVVTLARFDVSNADEADVAIKKLLEDPSPIGVLVNNAGVVGDAPFPALGRAAWESVTRTTIDGFYNVTQPLVMPMVRARWGRIVNVSSVSGVVGSRGQVNYSAAKAGLIGATRSLAQELAKRNVTVNAIAPGFIDTDMVKGAHIDELLRLVPMRRFGTAAEVAALVAYLVSDAAAYITGQVIGINGGIA